MVDLQCCVDFRGEGNGTPLQYSCLENPMDRRVWKAAVHGVAEGRTQLSDFTFTFHFHALELISGVYQSDLVIYIYIYIIFFKILFHYSLSQDSACSSLCYIVGPCWLSIL